MSEDERQYMRVPKELAEIVMGKLSDEGLIDEEGEVKWEGEFVSFPFVFYDTVSSWIKDIDKKINHSI